MSRKRRLFVSLSSALAFGLALAVASGPATAAGFCCRPSKMIRLLPTADGLAQGMVSGTAEIDECLGMSFLRIVAYGRVPNGTQLIPVLPGLEPLIGDWFTMMNGRGESVMPEMDASRVIGRSLDIVDESFTPLLTGQF